MIDMNDSNSGINAEVLTQLSRFLLSLLLTFCAIAPALAQNSETGSAKDSLWTIELPVMVVTATKSEISLRDVPIPTKVLLADQIKKRGVLRLSDLLAEEPGMLQVHYFGSGIQLQGFDSEYTLILIDGQPVVGRNGGTLDLDRLSVSDIESVEIVQGPSSSLYGSEALAGVINLRSKRAVSTWGADASYRVQTNGTRNTSFSGESRRDWVGIRFNYERFESDGYDLSKDVIGLTGPGFTTHTFSTRIDTDLTPKVSLGLTARLADENQTNTIGFDQSGVQLTFDEKADQRDWSLSPELSWRINTQNKVFFRGHASEFETQSVLVDPGGTSTIAFNQEYRKAEIQHDLVLGNSLFVSTGGGVISEQVRADRIAGDSRSNETTYAYTQQQWFPVDALQLTTSVRLDNHTDYGTWLSPKGAVMFKSQGSTRIRASVGTGFKAPSFQQLYMDFTNAVAGYTVVGAADASSAVQNLDDLGQIQVYLTDPTSFSGILPESSLAFNLSSDFDVTSYVHVHVGLFRNNVKDLIETLPVAAKPNGQNVFTYVNLNRIYTQGLTTEIRYQTTENLSLTLGYQLLEAKDRNVLDEIERGNVFSRRNGKDFRLDRSDYGGLMNRSRHSGTVQIAYRLPESQLDVRIRGSMRSRYGFGDRNGNLILDADNEYVAGYSVWNATLSKSIRSRILIQSGINNLFGYKNPEFVPSLSGRQFFTGLSFSIN